MRGPKIRLELGDQILVGDIVIVVTMTERRSTELQVDAPQGVSVKRLRREKDPPPRIDECPPG